MLEVSAHVYKVNLVTVTVATLYVTGIWSEQTRSVTQLGIRLTFQETGR